MWKEFKEFIMRGNVVELAIGLVMGSAFTAIVNALVDSIIMPFIAGLSGNASVEGLAFNFNGTPIYYGVFLQAVIDFLLIAIVLFFAIKAINSFTALHKQEEEVEEEEPTAEDYLKEIRDLLAEDKISEI
ncbi:large conductance mechanosensitive channel [Atopostipes suicloacalis DSM 15692]|mgnify:CR=1 FL=1|uniref:Large-conductance mechanosensitive channel n=1 Tax=Atopostipes suicloacalis DSM 15692 TaxID=1121025 RepID=A0A1M4Z428_9LACT|nr:large conductance mechanosensitive channel protein MscL [Atopostipes suicloacalis]SHF12715.1 large conductance mechanosensitive channel [Atopostipes suicloacalis DSM 15692]